MMNDVYVLDRNLKILGVIDSYNSLIWANRYVEVGDCELYVPATEQNLTILQKNNYLFRLDDDMVCRIKKIELNTDPIDGNYITISAYDVKNWLDQRIVWGMMTCNGNQENFIRTMVDGSLGSTANAQRQVRDQDNNPIFFLGTAAGFDEVLTEQISYANIGDKVRSYCKTNGWGYKVTLENGRFMFYLYKGTDRSDSVYFSDNYENLRETDYVEDETNMGNVAFIAGEGEGADRQTAVAGTAVGSDRYELYVDARDISKTITYGDLTETFPLIEDGGQGYIIDVSGVYNYYCLIYDVLIIDDNQLALLQQRYPSGSIVTVQGIRYYRIPNALMATLVNIETSEQLEEIRDSDTVVLDDLIYDSYLLTRGYEELSEYGSLTSFNGTVEPNTTFIFKKDYFLGDIVTVENEYGMTVEARIVEVVEVNDINGYYVEPKFEYISEE